MDAIVPTGRLAFVLKYDAEQPHSIGASAASATFDQHDEKALAHAMKIVRPPRQQKMRLALLIPVIALVVAGGLASNTTEASLDASQQARYQKLCESLVAPCCWSESVARHRSPESLQVRDEVAALILAGNTDQEILDAFTARYGARIRIEPAGSRARWLYVLPVLALLAGTAAAIHFLRTRTRSQAVAGASPPAVNDSDWDW